MSTLSSTVTTAQVLVKLCDSPEITNPNDCYVEIEIGGSLYRSTVMQTLQAAEREVAQTCRGNPIPMLLWCPECGERHVDRGEFERKEHHTHSCQYCGMTWRPAVVATVGVLFLPGFKDAEEV